MPTPSPDLGSTAEDHRGPTWTGTPSVPLQVALGDVQRILDEHRPAEETIRAVRRVFEPPVRRPLVERTERDWPILTSAWERHDDPEMA